jgi:hypothetical protein
LTTSRRKVTETPVTDEAPPRYKSRKVIEEEKIPIDPDAENETEEPEEDEEDAEAARYLQQVRPLREIPLRYQVYGQADDGRRYLGALTPNQVEEAGNSIHEAIKKRWGGGEFEVLYTDPDDTERTRASSFQIEGPSKLVPESPLKELPKNPAFADNPLMAMFTMQMERDRIQMEHLREERNAAAARADALLESMTRTMGELAQAARQPAPTGGGNLDMLTALEKIIQIERQMRPDTGKIAELVISAVEKIAPSLVVGAGGGETSLLQTIIANLPALAPAIKDILATARLQQVPPGVAPPVGAAPIPFNNLAPTQPVGAPIENIDPQALAFRQAFEREVLPKLVEQAEADVHPWDVLQELKQLIPEPMSLFPFLGLKNLGDFYRKYPTSAPHREWFDDLFAYAMGVKPEFDEEEKEQHAEIVR